jgi:hypothetical protein
VTGTRPPPPPSPRGPISERLLRWLRGEIRSLTALDVPTGGADRDDDLQLALTCCYELHYAGFAEVDDGLEWAPELVRFRGQLERAFLDRLEAIVGPAAPRPVADVVGTLQEIATDARGPSLSRHMLRDGTRAQMREFCVHRSEYQRKEADPHTWMIPRLRGRAKAAAVAIQHDEYGAGRADAMHSELFATTMRALALDPAYGAYRDLLPGTTLATGNLVTMLGLHRRLRGACVGHLALFEMTSVVPMGRYSTALARLGVDPAARAFYDVHVEADAWHEQVAQLDLVQGFVAEEPDQAALVVFGARALAHVESAMATAMLDAWERGTSSLRAPIPDPVPA